MHWLHQAPALQTTSGDRTNATPSEGARLEAMAGVGLARPSETGPRSGSRDLCFVCRWWWLMLQSLLAPVVNGTASLCNVYTHDMYVCRKVKNSEK